jgi:hypothetical protein
VPFVIHRASRSRVAAAAIACLLAAWVVSVAGPAAASPDTFKRAATNILFGPADFALAPVVASRAVYQNLSDIDDSTGVRIAYAVPGVAWNTAFVMGGAVLRTFSGLLEIIPGIILLPFEADMDPIYAPAERADALIWEEFDAFTLKVGINYLE